MGRKPSISGQFLTSINALLSIMLSVLVCLWMAGFLSIPDAERIVTNVREALPIPRAIVGTVALLVLVLNVYHLISCISSARYHTHLRTETDDGEMSIAVGAVEDTLRRAINELEEISEATVDVLKETAASPGDTHVRATISTYEKTNFRDVMERVRSVLKQRWDEIIDEQDEKPYFEIVMGAVSDETPSGSIGEGDRQTTSDGRDTEPYLSDPNEFSGPDPPDEEEKTSSDDR